MPIKYVSMYMDMWIYVHTYTYQVRARPEVTTVRSSGLGPVATEASGVGGAPARRANRKRTHGCVWLGPFGCSRGQPEEW